MSRAFVSDKEDWVYCAKAGERCFYAASGKDCRRKDCEHYSKALQESSPASNPDPDSSLRVVSRREKSVAQTRPDRKPPATTKKSNVKIKRRWGGRSG